MSEEVTKVPAIRFKGFTDPWEQRKLGDHAEIKAGGTPKTGVLSYWEPKEVPWMSSGEVNKKRLYSTDNQISQAGLENSSARWVKEKSILIALAGQGKTRGTVAITEIPITTNQSIAAIEVGETFDPEFVYQNLGSRYDELRIISSGDGTRGGLNKQLVADVNIVTPSVGEQRKIGELFKDIDKTITLQQRELDLMKKQKQTLLSKMFPKTGEQFPEIRFKGFTDPWEQRKLGELGKTFNGLSGKTKDDFGHGDAKFVTYMNVYQNAVASLEQLDSIEIDSKQNEVKKGDVFFTTSSETPEEVGMSSVWKYDYNNVYLNSFTFGYRPNVKLDLDYLAFMLRSGGIRNKITFLAQGISRYNISKTKMMDIEVLIPRYEEQQKIGEFLANIEKTITLQQRKLDQMKIMKKSLLKAMFV